MLFTILFYCIYLFYLCYLQFKLDAQANNFPLQAIVLDKLTWGFCKWRLEMLDIAVKFHLNCISLKKMTGYINNIVLKAQQFNFV